MLAPTREIAVQIQEVITSIGCALPKLRCHTFIGGVPLSEDREKLKKCHIAVGTPGMYLKSCTKIYSMDYLFILSRLLKFVYNKYFWLRK